MRKNIVFIILLVLGFTASPVLAHRGGSGDMLTDMNLTWLDRPAVPSDRDRGADMFAPQPLMVDRDADLVSGVRPRVTYGREEMVVVHPMHVPDSPLFRDPRS